MSSAFDRGSLLPLRSALEAKNPYALWLSRGSSEGLVQLLVATWAWVRRWPRRDSCAIISHSQRDTVPSPSPFHQRLVHLPFTHRAWDQHTTAERRAHDRISGLSIRCPEVRTSSLPSSTQSSPV